MTWRVDPPHADHQGEIVVIVIQGRTFRLTIGEAVAIRDPLLAFASELHDAITRAGGIEPRSGDPI